MKLPFRRRRGSGLRLPESRTLHHPRPARPHRPSAPPGPPRPTAPRESQRESTAPSSKPQPSHDDPVISSGPRRILDEPDAETGFDSAPVPPPLPGAEAAGSTAGTAAPPAGAPAAPPRRPRIALPHALPQHLSEVLGRSVAATGLTPNMLTVIGLLGSGGAAALAAYGYFWQAGIVMLAAGAFDLLDGAVARATGRATTWGAIFDAVSDRLGEFAMFLGLLVWFSAPAHFDRDAVILIGVSIGGAMLVSYTRSKAGEYGVRVREGLGTRFERVVILAIGLFADEVVAVLWILAVLTNLTALQRWGLTWWALRRFDDSAQETSTPADMDAPAGGSEEED